MVGIGATSTAQAIENAKIAENAGADYLLLMTPWFERPSLKGIEEYIRCVAEATKLPIMLYHHPYRTFFDWPVSHIAEMYFKFKGKVFGIKDSSCDYNRLIELKKLVDNDFDIFFECPDKFQQSEKLGAVGCIDGLTNLIPLEAVGAMKGDVNFIKQYKKSRSVLEVSKNYIGLLKVSLKTIGINVGVPFHPNHEYETLEFEKLKTVLIETGRINVKSQYADLPSSKSILSEDFEKDLQVTMKETLISKAPENEKLYRHHPSIIFFQNKLFSAWSEGFRNEDSRGQSIAIATSTDGLQWTKHHDINPTKQQKTYYSNGGFCKINDDLYLLVTEYSSARYAQGSQDKNLCWEDLTTSFYKLQNNKWDKTEYSIKGFYANEAPRLDENGNWIALGMDEFHNAVAIQSSGKTPFHFEKTILSNVKDGLQLSEPTWAIFNNQKTVYFRDLGINKFLWQSNYDAKEKLFSKPVITNYPNGGSKLFALPLFKNVTAIINNATTTPSHSRCKLHLGISTDGKSYQQSILLKDKNTSEPKFKGLHKMSGFQYPNACIYENHLHIIYSINKEDIGTIKIALTEIEKLSTNLKSSALSK